MEDILRAIGAKEVSAGIFEWELDDAKGKNIECEMAHVDIKGRLRDQLIEVVASKKPIQGEKAWDE
jgi:hypothetical protein